MINLNTALAHDTNSTTMPGKHPSGETVSVFTADSKEVVTVPSRVVAHLPRPGGHHGGAAGKKFVLCSYYHHEDPSSCPKGERCKYVHLALTTAELAAVPRSVVHWNLAWRSLDEVEYPRCEAGVSMDVAAPDGDAVVDRMDSAFVLATKAGDAPQQRHCAHYYFNRLCHLGPECHFLHAVFVDPEAVVRGRQQPRAPAPREIGRSLPHAAAAYVAELPPTVTGSTYASVTAPSFPYPTPTPQAVCAICSAAAATTPTPTPQESSDSAPPSDSDDGLSPLCLRYRRDPYTGGRVCVLYEDAAADHSAAAAAR